MGTDKKVIWDFYLIAAPGDLEHAQKLRKLLNVGGKTFLDPDDIEPGEDKQQAKLRAMAGAGLFVVLCGDKSRTDINDREELVRAVEIHRDDSNRRVVPLLLSNTAGGIDQQRYGTKILHALSIIEDGGWENVATKLIDQARRFRAVWQRKASVAIVCCHAELNTDSRMASEALRKLTGIDSAQVYEYDSEDSPSFAQAQCADKVVVLVGVRTGGTDVLEKLVDLGDTKTTLLRRDPPDFQRHCVPTEVAAALALGQLTKIHYPGPLDAGKAATAEVSRWLRDFSITRPGEAPTLEEWELAYLRQSVQRWRQGATGPLTSYAGKSMHRADYYVPLRASKTSFCWADKDETVTVDFSRSALPHNAEDPENKTKTFDPWLERVVSHRELPYLVLEGEAGSGKSVLVQHIACALAGIHGICDGDTSAEETQLDVEALRSTAPLVPIPIFVEARQLVSTIRSGSPGDLQNALWKRVRSKSSRAVDKNTFIAGLNRGRYLILVDSLDEVRSTKDREHLLDALGGLATDSALRSRVVLTTRPVAHTGVSMTPKGFQHLRLAPIDAKTAERLVNRWALARSHEPEEARQMWHVVSDIQTRHQIDNLVENPLLLVCTLLVYEIAGTLPESTADLYYRMVRTLCELRPRDGEKPDVLKEELQEVFSILQTSGRVALSVKKVADQWASRRSGSRYQDLEDRLDTLADTTGLVRFVDEEDESDTGQSQGKRRTVKVVRAWHRSFQEYLAATALTATKDSVDTVVDRLFSVDAGNEPGRGKGLAPFWTGTLRFVAGAWGSGDRTRAHVQRLLDHAEVRVEGSTGSSRPGYVLGLAAAAIAEYGRYFPDGDALKSAVRHRIVDRFEAEGDRWTLEDRLLALDELGRIDDPRLERERWVSLPGGPFVMGGDRLAYQSAPAHKVTLAPFQMAWCPVTVWDYAKFIARDGYVNKEHWAEIPTIMGRRTEPRDWTQQKRWPNRPVVGVSWYEAMAYCAWLRKETGLSVRLPTEAEWEYAAKFGHQGDFPWQDDDIKGQDDYQRAGRGDDARANYDWSTEKDDKSAVSPPKRPTPVGVFPKGNNHGMVDLAGNVWEWCLDAWKGPNDPSWQDVDNPCHQGDIQAGRAVRGGSWFFHPGWLRCAYRYYFVPDYRYDYLGFRVLLCGFGQHALKVEP